MIKLQIFMFYTKFESVKLYRMHIMERYIKYPKNSVSNIFLYYLSGKTIFYLYFFNYILRNINLHKNPRSSNNVALAEFCMLFHFDWSLMNQEL